MNKVFNLKKVSQMLETRDNVQELPASDSASNPPLLMDQAQDAIGDSVSDVVGNHMPSFKNGAKLADFLEVYRNNAGPISAFDEAWNFFAKRIDASLSSDVVSEFKDGLERFYESESGSNDSVKIATNLFNIIYPSQENDSLQEINTKEIQASNEIDDIILKTDSVISHMAKKMAMSSSRKPFNLSKTAQQKTITDSVVMSGPSQVGMSPFTRDMQSSMHLVEQNKGFGLRIGDILDIDFEAIWRGNVMDKYYRPTRDSSGMYGGGYIDDKFEVNRFIPVGNEYQLPPNVRSRPYIPEHGLLEARMEVARGNKDQLSDPRKFAKIYNHLSSSKKKV